MQCPIAYRAGAAGGVGGEDEERLGAARRHRRGAFDARNRLLAVRAPRPAGGRAASSTARRRYGASGSAADTPERLPARRGGVCQRAMRYLLSAAAPEL